MKSFFKELFEYNFNFNQKILHSVMENHALISDTVIKLHSHIINVHCIWNSRIITAQVNFKPWDPHSVKDMVTIDKENFNSSLTIIDQFDLDFQIQYSTLSGNLFNNNVRDILFQIINHSTYHRGQIATAFRQCHIEPLLTDWIFYKMR